ncbi:putative epidermal cell surface receptor isoform X2 [Harmonia axyridis]|uniref:putative epidermal cell surface receptor isoform X2 n=1 Tax=Harmonia axyridis TaxID=115357 RepID=UPI001E278AF0|nr:putative epidermal cell surface receptor isoform X2 [Harmonia axyridis]
MATKNFCVVLFVVLLTLDGPYALECPQGSVHCSNDTEITPDLESTQTSKPASTPLALSMVDEDHTEATTPSQNVSNSVKTDVPRGRALNFTSNVLSNGVSTSNTSFHNKDMDDLSDVTINEEEEEMHIPNIPSMLTPSNGSCTKGGFTYHDGERVETDCDTVCTCDKGVMNCRDRCQEPLFRRGRKINDPMCQEKSTDDPCCGILVCANSATEPSIVCHDGNKTYTKGDTFHRGCEETCTCENGGNVVCKPRCQPRNTDNNIKCVEVQDPEDSCCKKLLCDVTLNENESEVGLKITSAKYLNSSMIRIKFEPKLEENDSSPIVELGEDDKTWQAYKLLPGGFLPVQNHSKFSFIRLEGTNEVLPLEGAEVSEFDKDSQSCAYKGRTFKLNEEFNDNCTQLCSCKKTGMVCLKLDCPTYFGTDVLDSGCVEWETVPPNFVPSPPMCCPTEVRCKNNGSCEHKGEMYQNWQHLPTNVTGCEKQCYCEMGKIECQNVCPPMTALPGPDLPCPPHMATVGHLPNDDCCMQWVCKSGSEGVQNKTNSTDHKTPQGILAPFGLNPTKPPSKTLGPLLSYANPTHPNDTRYDSSPKDNPFVHTPPNHDKDPITNLVGTETPEGANRATKPSESILVTPLPPTSTLPTENDNLNLVEEKTPTKPHGLVPQQIHIVGKGDAEDILSFINNHPELTNYPSGSVLEIHKVSPKNPLENQIFVNPQRPNGPPVPYQHFLHQMAQQGPLNMALPPGITLEQILEELHKNGQLSEGGASVVTLPHVQGRPQMVATQHAGLNRPNGTFTGHPFPGFPNNFQNHDDIQVHTLEAVDAHTIRLAFLVPPVIVGLHGRVEVRYTDKRDAHLDNWELQVFAPPNDLIATPQLEFDLLGLKANTEYKIQITITLRDLHNTPTSQVYRIRTPPELASSTLPPMIPIDPELNIAEVNSTWVTAAWRKFTEYELQFIDGIQLRFKEIDGRIYAATPLIHRAVSSYTIENLKPNTKYEIGIYFIPFPGETTELHAERMAHFTTANEVDNYGFNVTLEIGHVKSTSVEISWFGVPYPEDKYVNIYRAIYQSDSGKEDQSTFKIAKRDSPTKTVILDLKPGTRYRLWLEVYLTNGKIKTSNVQDFLTKPRAAPVLGSASRDKLSSEEELESKGDYYAPLVIVAILAAIAIMSTLVLLLVLLRRHNQNKAAITPPSRISQSAYDNPTYKVEIQQETMGL